MSTVSDPGVVATGAVVAVVSAVLGWIGTRRSKDQDALVATLSEVREWGNDLRETEAECREQMKALRAELEELARELAATRAELARTKAEVVRLEQIVEGS